jgi:hypothetical protein
MKYLIATAFCLTLISKSYCQVIPIETFTSLLGKQLSYINDTFTKDFRTELDVIDEGKGIFTWKKGFNGDHSANNQYIIYKKTDSTYEFWYTFVTDLLNDIYIKTYYDYYEKELNDSKYKKNDDTIEDWGYKAIVKNYQFGNYIIKIGNLASTNSTMRGYSTNCVSLKFP